MKIEVILLFLKHHQRLFLFAARDIWFVVALPVFLASQLEWSHHGVSTFIACWIIGYGIIQASAPKLVKITPVNTVSVTAIWAFVLAIVCAGIYLGITHYANQNSPLEIILVIGLLAFGAVFAINSALHSFVIIAIAKEDGVSMDVGFYYMANALGRLLGTVLSGYIFQVYGLAACLLGASIMALLSSLLIKYVKLTADQAISVEERNHGQ